MEQIDVIEIWEHNIPAFLIFSRLITQWHHTQGLKTGLRYSSVHERLDKAYPNDSKAWEECFDDIQTMELAALEQMAADQPKN